MKPEFGNRAASLLAHWIAQPGNLTLAENIVDSPTWLWPRDIPTRDYETLRAAIAATRDPRP